MFGQTLRLACRAKKPIGNNVVARTNEAPRHRCNGGCWCKGSPASLRVPRRGYALWVRPAKSSTPLYTRIPKRTMFILDEPTPNPDSLKFIPEGVQFSLPPSSTFDYPNLRSAFNSPLAKMLFQQEGVKRVFLANDFITITKDDVVEWENLRPIITGTLVEFFSSGQPAVTNEPGNTDTVIKDSDSEEVAMIKELFETRIRPAIQSDGGDVTYLGFEDGVVFVKLSGSCSGCPSSSVTLKSGIERLLMHWVPEVKGVMEVESEEEYQKVIGNSPVPTLKEISDQQLEQLEQTLQSQKQPQQ